MKSLTVTIPKILWLTSNRPVRSHAHRARIVREIHERTALAAYRDELDEFDGRVHAWWTIHYPKGTGWVHGDAANAHPTCKAILDGLVLGGWLAGDGPRLVRPETYDRGPNLALPVVHDVTLELRRAEA